MVEFISAYSPFGLLGLGFNSGLGFRGMVRCRCKLTSREADVLTLLRDGCPEITERQAVDLIAKIDDKKLAALTTAIDGARVRIRESAVSLQRT